MIRSQRGKQAEPFAHDVERAVAIEEALAAVTADDRAEAEIAVTDLRFGGDAGGERAGIEGRCHRIRV